MIASVISITAVRRQAVHEDGVRRRASHERFVYLVGRENLVPLLLFVLVTHAGPGVGVDRVSAIYRLFGVVEDLDNRAGLLGEIAGIGHDLRVAFIACRRGDANLRAESGCGQQQRMRDVVAIADVGSTDFLQIAEALLQGEVVGQRLAGMLQVAECVDDRNAGVLGHSFNRAVRIGAQHDGIHPAFDIVRDVAQLFARVQAPGRLIHKERVAAHAGHSSFESEAGAQRCLFEKHHHLFAGQCCAEI